MDNGAPTFANARYVMGKTEFDFWTAPERMSGPTEGNAKAVAANVKPLAEKTTFVDDGGEVVTGIRAVGAPGHTPGHTSYLISDGDAQALVLGDITNRPELNLAHPGWHLVFDMDAAMAEKTRREVFDRVETDRIRCIGYHFPFPANGYVAKDGDGYRFIPADWSAGI